MAESAADDEPIESESVPAWALWPVPPNASLGSKELQNIEASLERFEKNPGGVSADLYRGATTLGYELMVNRFIEFLWPRLPDLYRDGSYMIRRELLYIADQHFPPQLKARVVRRLVRDPEPMIAKAAMKMAEEVIVPEVALPNGTRGRWDQTGWTTVRKRKTERHPQGRAVQERYGVPVLKTIADVRSLLEIRSEKQLGWLLLATDNVQGPRKGQGPYQRFTIKKRSGRDREICAPNDQLRWVQRRLLQRILRKIEPHGAAHGFVPGRSTLTNAAPHLGSELVLKFDLENFFPTISYFRVLGFFTRLGYTVENSHFASHDESTAVAATLARLCVYAPDAHRFGEGYMPQGAPTSPTLSNLICRRLDARLTGLAESTGGRYTRYADDLTFSFEHDSPMVGRFRWWVDQICHQEGFIVNQQKFRVIRKSQRQTVTGIVVNDCLRVPRPQCRRFRAMLHEAETKGIDVAARGRTNFRSWLRGFASYLAMVHPEEGREQLDRVKQLLERDASDGETA